MTKTQRDIPANEGMTIADRLKAARENAGMTRKALSDATGIPYGSIEKYERGEMDPNTTRLRTICEQLQVSFNSVLNGDADPEPAETSETAEILPSETSSEGSMEDIPEASAEPSQAGSTDTVSALLIEIDRHRANAFEGAQRRVLALAEDAKRMMKYLEPDELISLAADRGLYDGDCHSADFLDDLFQENPEEARTTCGNVEERILDTAILGVDLYGIEREPLVELADEFEEKHDISPPAWGGFSWGDHEDFVSLIRPHIREMAYRGNAMELTNPNEFPRREE